MAKSSRGGKRSGGGFTAEGELVLPNGSKIEFDGKLTFDGDDKALSGTARANIENWEAKRGSNKVEYAFAVDGDGNPIGAEIRGSKGSVRVPRNYHETDNATFTHIHPRGDGMLGGTFSSADLNNFANCKNKTVRARAKEGTYSISKGANFDKAGFSKMVADANRNFSTNQRKYAGEWANKYRSGQINYSTYLTGVGKAFNTALVQLHNEYRSHQKEFGYTYTLERNKG